MFIGVLLASTPEDNDEIENLLNATEYSSLNLTDGISEETSESLQDVSPEKYQDISKLRVYNRPLPKFPGTTTSPWIALHSPVKMYIPIRNTDEESAESENCIQCPRNMIIYLSIHQSYILMPVPAISICPNLASLSGRVHVAVVSGPRPRQRLNAGRYQVELMVWKAEGPVHSCKYSILVKERRRVTVLKKEIPCPRPEQPSNGIVLCDRTDRKHYSHDSVCQIFCEINFLVENTSRNSSTIICKNGQWTPEKQVSCVAVFCPELPSLTEHSYWSCDVEDVTESFSKGARCKITCAPGYVIPASQMERNTVVCEPPSWKNSKIIPGCTRAHLPKLIHCQNRHIIIRSSQSVTISQSLMPKGTNSAGESLRVVCSLQGKSLRKGKHQNICEVTDPELNTRRKCNYRIHIEESSAPHPHPGDCKNRTVLANQKDSVRLKPVRFLVKVGSPVRTRVLRSNCKPKGDLPIGNHFIVCKVTDPHTKLTGKCSYWMKIKKRSCPPLRQIQNTQIICPSQVIGSVCHYKCSAGYSFVGNHSTRATKYCQVNLRWKPPLYPVCKYDPPVLLEGCNDLEVELALPDNFTVPTPKFLTSVNETLNISCSPPIINTAGLHHVLCICDYELFNTSCRFNVSVSARQELITNASNSSIKDGYPHLIEGCEDLEVNQSISVHFSVPVPRYLTSLNETMNVTCAPNVLTTAGQHKIMCAIDDDAFNVSCHFNVSLKLIDIPIAASFPEKADAPVLVESCDNLEINLPSPVHFHVPVPLYSADLIDNVSCTPNVLTAPGRHQISCTRKNDIIYELCYFNITISLEEESTYLPTSTKGPILELVSGCDNIEINTSLPINFTVPQPKFVSLLNDTVLSSCIPSLILIDGHHEVECLVEDYNFNASCNFNVTILLEDETILASSERGSCKPLSLPRHSSIHCTTVDYIETCQVMCDPGYGFSEDNSITVSCSGDQDGLWDFQKLDINETLADCLAQMEGSAVEVWISFEASALHCEEELENVMRDLVNDLCQVAIDTNCTNIVINCTLDEESDRMLMIVNWTIRVDFNDEDYYDDEEIPEAEVRLEAVMERTRMFLATDDAPDGLHLFRDSFRKGFITLVCPDRFTPNSLMSRCLQSPEE